MENKSLSASWLDPNSFWKSLRPQKQPIKTQKSKNDYKIKTISNVRIEGNMENKNFLHCMSRPQNNFLFWSQPPK